MPSFLDIYLLYTEFTGFTISLFTAILYRINRVLSLKSIPYMWRNARMARSTPWRATLGMPASSRAIQSGAALSTVTDALPIDGRMGEGKPEVSPLVLLPYISPAPSLL